MMDIAAPFSTSSMRKYFLNSFVLTALIFLSTNRLVAQVDGFWLVTKVMVGEKENTPAGKWVKLALGKMTTGNGWTQHSTGTYKFDKKKLELSIITFNEPTDKYGAFKVERKGNIMTWTREEEGELVKVELKPITDLPSTSADEIKGLWGLTKATKGGEDISKQFDPDHKRYIFIRWDRIYVRQNSATESVSGFWFMNAQKSELRLINESRQQEDEVWSIVIVNNVLTMIGVSKNVEGYALTYSRLKEFPR